MGGSKVPTSLPRRAMEAAGLVCGSLVLLLALEGGLRAAGVGGEEFAALDFGTARHENIYGPDPDAPGGLTLAPWIRAMKQRNIRKLINPDRFPAHRPEGELRIFAVGESTVFGYPVGGDVAFPRRLQEILSRRGMEVRVVNAGIPAYDSGRVVGVLREVVGYEPQVVVLYSGHNEFLRRFALERIATLGWRFRLRQRLVGLRTYQLLAGILRPLIGEGRASLDATELVEEVPESRSRVRPRTAMESALVVDRFRRNIAEGLRLAGKAGVRVVLCTVASRLQSAPEHSVPPSDAAAAVLSPLLSDLDATHAPGAREALARSVIDAAWEYAPAHHELGRLLEARGERDAALSAYQNARELETNPRRGGTAINEALRDIGRRGGATVVDLEAMFLAMDDRGCFGEQLFWDHCHPDAEGHTRMAEALAAAIDGGGGTGDAPAPSGQ